MARLNQLLSVFFDAVHLLEQGQQLLLHPLGHGVAVEDVLHGIHRLFGQRIQRPSQIVEVARQLIDARRTAEIVTGVVLRQPASFPSNRLVVFIDLNSCKPYYLSIFITN